jgi:gluconolactonase
MSKNPARDATVRSVPSIKPEATAPLREEVVAEGLGFPEGPCVDRRGRMHLVDLAQGRIAVVKGGDARTVVDVAGAPNGAAYGPDGDLYFCNNGGNWPATPSTGMQPGLGGRPGLIQRLGADGKIATVLEAIDGRPLNSPNDICFDDRGGFYFTDPVWPDRDPDGTIQPDGEHPGEVGHVDAAGRARRVADGIMFPNGIQVLPDGRGLLVGETVTGRIHYFPIESPGRLGPSDVYVELGADAGPDGMKLDASGRLLVAGSGSSRVFVVAVGGGSVEREVRLQDPMLTNLCFGGPEYRTVFVTQATLGRLVSFEWEEPGFVAFPDRQAGRA